MATNKVVIQGTGPHVRIKGTGSVKVFTDKGVVKVPLNQTTDLTFLRNRKPDGAAA